jgi:hypothetical protein
LDGRAVVAEVEPVVQAGRDEARVGRHLLGDQLEQRDRAWRRDAASGQIVLGAVAQDAIHAGLDVGVEGGVLHLVDLLEGD